MSAEFNSSLCTHHSALRLKALKRAAHVVNGGRGGGPARALLLLRVKLLALLQLAAGALFVAVGGQGRLRPRRVGGLLLVAAAVSLAEQILKLGVVRLLVRQLLDALPHLVELPRRRAEVDERGERLEVGAVEREGALDLLLGLVRLI